MPTGSQIYLQKSAQWLVLGIVATVPMIFGAVHPLLIGFYTFVMLVGFGGWLLLNPSQDSSQHVSLWALLPLFLLLYVVAQSIPLPLEIVEILSPYRAERVGMVNLLVGTDQKSITLSEVGTVGVYKAVFLFSLLLYYHSLKQLLAQDQSFLNIIVMVLVAIGAFEALYGLIQFVSPQVGILWLSLKGRAAHGTIIYKNQYASLVNMIWPLALASGLCFFLKKKKKTNHKKTENKLPTTMAELADTKVRAILYVFAAIMMCLAVLFSLSRGGILAMALVAISFTFLLPFSKTKKLVSLLAFIVFVCSYGAILGLDTIISRFNSMGGSGAVRFDIYLSSLPMLMDHWLTGIGMGAYTLLSPVYLKGFAANIHFDRVHNEYLELVIELGIPVAAMLFIWMVSGMGKIFYSIVKNVNRRQVEMNRFLLGIAAFCGLFGFLTHGVVDFGWRLPANLVYAITLLAITVHCLDEGPGPQCKGSAPTDTLSRPSH
ncbi:MAG: hypothetical protein ACI8ZB_000692 [Desulforhopalus sp.]|jgi:hypothetical protein